MKLRALQSALRWLPLMALIPLAFGCDGKSNPLSITNQRPLVRLTAAPIDTSGLYYYSYTVNWVGYDPDGRVDHYLYTIDPQSLAPGEDTVWTETNENERRLFFQSTERFLERSGRYIGRDHHIFVIKAIDDKGQQGPHVSRAFFSYTVAPEVRITNPHPGAAPAYVTPAVRINWLGEDPDGVFTAKPVKYKYILLSASSEFPKDLAYTNPDSLRRYYVSHPLGPWAGWDSTSADTTQVQYTNLTPGSEYMFVVVAFDEAGAYSPLMDITLNMLRLRVGFAGTLGPKITMFNEYFNYTYRSGGFCVCPKAQVPVEVPGKIPVHINWFAEPPEGADIKHYRWALDIDDVTNDTPRENEERDTHLWSTPSANVTSATVGPFRGGENHFFYIEAEDNNGLKSLGIVLLQIVEPTFDTNPTAPLLIIDDTRLGPDVRQVGQTCMAVPRGSWPNRAEMDTFLFARGGYIDPANPALGKEMKEWRCYGTNKKPLPGLFAGYEFDTLGTRTGRNDLTVKLSVIGQYPRIIWMTDASSAINGRVGTSPTDPMSAMRYMCTPGNVNTLAAYVKAGGKLWVNGGAAGYAATDPFNDAGNDQPSKRYSWRATRPELVIGRFMYDIARWQTTFRAYKAQINVLNKIQKSTGRYRSTGTYAGLPQALDAKTPETDPLEDNAPIRQSSAFFANFADTEFLEEELYITQAIDTNGDDEPDTEISTLDTLYRIDGVGPNRTGIGPDGLPDPEGQPGYVVMTYYKAPAPSNETYIHSGFSLWFYQRAQLQQLVDYVLQSMWGMTKGPVPRRTSSSRAVSASAAAGSTRPLSAKTLLAPAPRFPRD